MPSAVVINTLCCNVLLFFFVPQYVAVQKMNLSERRRDGTSEISSDPRTKRLETRRVWLACLQKHTNITHGSIYTYTYTQKFHTSLQLSTRESANMRFHNFRVIIFFFFFFFRPDFSLPEQVQALIFPLNVPRYGGGLHRRQAMFVFFLRPWGPCNLVEVASPFHAITTVESVIYMSCT